MKTIRKSFPKIRTYIRRRKRRFEVDARGNGVGRRFYFTNRTTAFTKAKEIAALVQPRTEAAPLLHLQKPDLLKRLLALLEGHPISTTTDRPLHGLLDEWVESRRNDKLKPLRPRSLSSLVFAARRFRDIFTDLPLQSLNRERVEAVFSKQKWSPQSLRNYRGMLSQFFNWCIRREYTTKNPVEHIQVATVHRTVRVYSLDQVRNILTLLRRPKFVGLTPYITLGLFAGVRPLEIERMTWGTNVHMGTEEIEIQGEISKTKRPRRFRMEPVLVSWLRCYRKDNPKTPLICPHFGKLIREFQNRIGCPWITDGLRHTFGTYHYNRDKSLGHLTFVMGNSEAIARRHYLTTLPQADVGRFWELGPTA